MMTRAEWVLLAILAVLLVAALAATVVSIAGGC